MLGLKNGINKILIISVLYDKEFAQHLALDPWKKNETMELL